MESESESVYVNVNEPSFSYYWTKGDFFIWSCTDVTCAFPQYETHWSKKGQSIIIASFFWLTCFLLFKFQNNLEDVFGFAMDMLSEEAQPSVRLVVEWINILLLLRNPHLRRHLWENLKRGSDKKAACLCSLHSIVMHLSKLITDPLEKVGKLYLCR